MGTTSDWKLKAGIPGVVQNGYFGSTVSFNEDGTTLAIGGPYVNNDGIETIKARIKSDRKKGILGVNIGPNKETHNQNNLD